MPAAEEGSTVLLDRFLRWLPAIAGGYTFAGGLLTLLGWVLDRPRLTGWFGGLSTQPNAAIATVLAAAALLLLSAGRRKFAAWFGFIVLGIGGATLLEHVTGIDLGIDRLLLFDRPWGTRATLAPGRMGIPASVSWVLAGYALVALRKNRPTPAAVPAIGVALAAISLLSLTGYLFGADMLFALPRLTAIAMQTATFLLAIGVGLLAVASDRSPVRILLEDSAAGTLAWRAFPVVILLPIGIGLLCALGYRAGLYDPSMAIALLVLSLIGGLSAVLGWGVAAVRSREESLRRSQNQFARFMQHLPGLAWIKDSAGRYIYANDAATAAFQLPLERLYGKTDDELFPPETADQFRAHDRQAMQSAQGVQVVETLKHNDGVLHHSLVSKFPIAGAAGQLELVGGMAIDITERRRAEETVRSLLRISARLNSTLDVNELLDILIQEAIQLIEVEGGASGLLTTEGMVANKYFRQGEALPLDYCWPPLHGLPGWLIVHKGPYVTNDAKQDPQIVQSLCDTFGVWSALSTPILSAQGSLIGFFELHNKRDGTGFTAADQEILAAVSQVAAIAIQNGLAYRSLEEAKESLKDSDRRKDQFLAVLAHELRNPLAPIRTGLEIIRQSGGHAGVLQEAQAAMERQVTHLVRLVDDLLDLSRISRDKLELRKERMELAAVLRQAVETSQPLAAGENQSLELALPEEPILLSADAIRLTQVFGNLLNNACKFSPRGSVIHLAARREGSDCVVSVRDHGIGIPAEKIGQVFEMFTQVHQNLERSHQGLGIGLTLVRRLIEMHGGSVTATSAGEGQGSEFLVRLPILTPTPPPPPAPHGSISPLLLLPPRRVLVVDDNHDAARTLGALFRLDGHEVKLAHDGKEACAVAEAYRPDIILLDIGLPKLSGYEVCQAVRRQEWASDVVIVALTGWGQDDDRRRSAAAGFDGHIVKPVDYRNLLELLASQLPVPV
jgi:PAS domain S-box-containing protein